MRRLIAIEPTTGRELLHLAALHHWIAGGIGEHLRREHRIDAGGRPRLAAGHEDVVVHRQIGAKIGQVDFLAVDDRRRRRLPLDREAWLLAHT